MTPDNEQPTIPLGLHGAKFTSLQFDRLCKLAAAYLRDVEKFKGEEETTTVSQLLASPDAIDLGERSAHVFELQDLVDQTNAAIVAGQMATRPQRQQTLKKLTEVRHTAEERGQTARRRSVT